MRMKASWRHTVAYQSPRHVSRLQSRICGEAGYELVRRRLLRATYLVHGQRRLRAAGTRSGAIRKEQDQDRRDSQAKNDHATYLNPATQKPSANFASSDIISGDQGGSKTIFGCTFSIPWSWPTNSRICSDT